MAKVTGNGKDFTLALGQADFNSLGLNPAKDYEITKIKNGVYVLVEGDEKTAEPVQARDVEGEKIRKMLEGKDRLAQRVEGKFEKLLNNAELARFNEMLGAGEIEKFRLSDKYKKAVYQLKGARDGEGATEKTNTTGAKTNSTNNTPSDSGAQKLGAENSGSEHNPAAKDSQGAAVKSPGQVQKGGEFTLTKDGFMVVHTEGLAKQISAEKADDIKRGEILGIKSFDGPFYVVKAPVYERTRAKIEAVMKKCDTKTLDAIMKETGAVQELVRIVCELMKEEGNLIEKRKGLYKWC
ncbi:MAG: hypothetical protein ABH854_05355 [Candidatus Diapherotrites archaeon]